MATGVHLSRLLKGRTSFFQSVLFLTSYGTPAAAKQLSMGLGGAADEVAAKEVDDVVVLVNNVGLEADVV
jgi:hypothetical protein